MAEKDTLDQKLEQKSDQEDLSKEMPEDDPTDNVDLSFLKREEEKEGEEKQPGKDQEPHSTDRTETAPAAQDGVVRSQPKPDPSAQPQPTPPPVQPGQPVETAQPQPQAPSEADLEAGRRAAEAQDKAALDAMEASFGLSEEDVQALELEPAKIIPRLMAKVMFQSVKVAAQAVLAHLPQVVAQTQIQRDQSQEHEKAFFERWPQLKGVEGVDGMIVQQATMYRQLNPRAKVEDVIRDVGASITVALGQQIAAPQAGASEPSGNGSRRVSLPPINPAAASAPRSLPSGKQEENIFQGWASEDLME